MTFNVDDVIGQLAQLSSVISPKSPLTILGDLSVTTKNNCEFAVVTASDGEIWVKQKISLVQNDGEHALDFKFAVNGRDFVSTLKNLVGRSVTLELDENATRINGKYQNGHFELPCDNPDDFPQPNMANGGDVVNVENVVNAKNVYDAIMATEFSVDKTDIRPVCNGLHFDFFEDRMVCVALNSVSMGKYTDMSIKNSSANTDSFNMTARSAKVLTQFIGRMDDDVKLSFNSHNITVYCSKFVFTCRVQEGVYPPYDQLLRNKTTNKATISRDDAIHALRRVMPLGDTSSRQVLIEISGDVLTVSAKDLQFAKAASESISCDFDGESFRIGMNGSVLMDALSNIDCDYINMMVADEKKPILLMPSVQKENIEYITLIAPMMI